ncbi:MAG: D-alanine--D-alanine ligase [Coriobacteriales bacterium]|jgi:D-alanine-D-alanine ligase|nr:D-alanine--D-alanine ligase [Coriobacteriales bacterium]
MAYNVAVLMGGGSVEREFSLESGGHITRQLRARGHSVLPMDISPQLVETLLNHKVDVAYIALHGKGGEDGTIQALLEYLNIPYVGSSSAACRVAWNKANLPHALCSYRSRSGWLTVEQEKGGDTTQAALDEAPASWPSAISLATSSFTEMGAAGALGLMEQRIAGGYPLAVKPARGGSAMGVHKVDSAEGLGTAVLDALSFDTAVLIEKWVSGIELAVAVVGNGADARALPPVEIAPHRPFFDTEARQDANLVNYYCPVRASSLAANQNRAHQIRQLIEAAALEVHLALGCRDLSRIDMIWDGSRVQVLEANVSPGMTEHSLVPMACAAAALPFGAFVEELLNQAIRRFQTST